MDPVRTHTSPDDAPPSDVTASTVASFAAAPDPSFLALAEVLPQMLWITVPNGGVEYFSPRWERFTGRGIEELKGKGYLDLVHPDDRPIIQGLSADDFEKGGARATFRLRRHDGEYRWVEAFATSVRDASGRVVRFVGGTYDVTDRRSQENELRELGAQLASALELADLGRFVRYLREDRLELDERLLDILGFERGPEVPDPTPDEFFALIHPDDVGGVAAAVEAAMGGERYHAEYRFWRAGPNGQELAWAAARGRVEFDDEGPVRLVGVVEDVTLRRQEEELRALSQRRETLGALVGGIAHDFSNVLGAISSNAHLAEIEVQQGADPTESLDEVRRGVELAVELVRRMLDYSRAGTAEHTPVALDQIVRQAISLIRPTLPENVRIERSLDENLLVMGDETQLHQVVVNLVANAGQALATTGGTIAVGVGDAPRESDVRLTVRDDGPGMEPAVSRRAFDPFFTTKPPGGGTGLGLSTVRTIVRSHGGSIDVQTAPGEGTEFAIDLPRHVRPDQERAVARAAAAAAGQPVERPLTVLYVDDEAALTRLAQRALPLQGWQARTFNDPREAHAAFVAAPNDFDVLITDLSMPGLTGLELIAELRTLKSSLPVILTSGFLTPADHRQAEVQRVDAVLPKPCTLDQLVSTVREITGITT